jgi:hypothetical protein
MSGSSLLPAFTPRSSTAQPAVPLSIPGSVLPAAPQGQTGSISATVTDTDGASIPGARVTLTHDLLTGTKTVLTDKEGWFSFTGVAPGNFKLTVTASGFQDQTVSGSLKPGSEQTLPEVALHVAASASDIMVTLTPAEEAEMDVKAEETQHVAFLLPNFYITYNWHAPPLSTRQKYELAMRSTIDPGGNILNAATAGFYQAFNILPGYGEGAKGYAKRFGAVSADADIGLFLGGAVFPSLFHQDPRYFYMGKARGTLRRRALHAIASAVICRGDNGKTQFSYSGVLGDVAAGAASNLYYPPGSRSGATLTVENGLLSVAGDAASNLAQEFVVRFFTHNAPTPNP